MADLSTKIAELSGEIACVFHPQLSAAQRETLAAKLMKLAALSAQHAVNITEERIRNGTLRRIG